MAIQDKFNRPNVIYKITKDIDLGGGTLTIPEGCTLDFQGGGFSNGTIVLNNALLEGCPNFDAVDFNGSLKNGSFNPLWINEGEDIGYKINKAAIFFKSIKVPYNNYDLITPIKLEGMANVYLDGNYTYKGEVKNLGSAIELIKSSSMNFYLNSLVIDKSKIDYTDERTINFIGLCITSCNNIITMVNRINYFNENIRFQDTNALGCSYNKLISKELANGNIGVRFYMDDTNAVGSWCNETAVFAGRITRYGYISDPTPYGKTYGVVVAGPSFDSDTYKGDKTSSLDKSSNIHVYNSSFEHLNYGVCFKNVSGCGIHDCREEYTDYIAKFIGDINNFSYNVNYEYHKFDYTEIRTLVSSYYRQVSKIPIKLSEKYPKISYNNIFSLGSTAKVDQLSGAYTACIGAILDTSTNKFFKVRGFDRSGKEVSCSGCVFAKYLNDEGSDYLSNMSSYGSPTKIGMYQDAQKGFNYSHNCIVPNGVNRIFLGILLTHNEALNIEYITISSLDYFSIIVDKKDTYGTSDQRPSSLPLDVSYYDTTLNKPIWWTGSNWVDATGATV